MANLQGALGGAGTGAMIGSVIPGIGTAVGAGIGGLIGLFGGPRKKKFSADDFNADPNNMVGQRYDQLMDPNYMRQDFMQAARQLVPGQSSFFNRMRGSGLSSGVSSVMADEQFRAAQGRAVGNALGAFGQFRMNSQNQANSLLDLMTNNRARAQQMALTAQMDNQDRRDSYGNSMMSGAFGLAGNFLGNSSMFGGSQ